MQTTAARNAHTLALWLSLCCLLVFALILLGGAVRLSGSGLSMVEWRPLAGIAPPLDAESWARVFAQYRQTPEFHLVNPDISEARFRFIFFMEYAHRMLARVVALAFLIPFLFFLWRRMLPRALTLRLALLFFLGALQGLLGWHMVKSGLVDDPRVSHYRLAMHLMLAAALYAYLLRLALGLRMHARRESNFALRAGGGIALALIFCMLLSGALVAGTHAGLTHNTWPKMGAHWIPPQLFALHPWWMNFTENLLTIQFTHRWLAMLTLLALANFALQLFRNGARMQAAVIALLACAQILLGISALTLRAPFALAIAHQAGAVVLLSVTLAALAVYLRPVHARESLRAQ